MLKKFFIAFLGISFLLFTGTAYAYDLPKIKAEKKVSQKKLSKKKVADDNAPKLKSDWASFEVFDSKIKNLIQKDGTIPASSTERVYLDKNLIFVAYYKGNAYFLDRYSIQTKNNSDDMQSWSQRIFAGGSKVSAKNSEAVLQKFNFTDKKKYNSFSKKNDLDEVKNADDKIFLEECFKVGYYYAFDKEIDY